MGNFDNYTDHTPNIGQQRHNATILPWYNLFLCSLSAAYAKQLCICCSLISGKSSIISLLVIPDANQLKTS